MRLATFHAAAAHPRTSSLARGDWGLASETSFFPSFFLVDWQVKHLSFFLFSGGLANETSFFSFFLVEKDKAMQRQTSTSQA
jgi:hypothetical protein